MSRLIESIRLENGVFHNLFYHEERMNRAFRSLFGSEETSFNLEEFLLRMPFPKIGLYKCRLVYDDKQREVEFIPYVSHPPQTLQIVEHDRIHYEFKYEDRSLLTRLYELRRGADDILIVRRGLVTDTHYGNIAFRLGKIWYTPYAPLLKGTQRQYLIERENLREEEITSKDINSFEAFRVINSMLLVSSPEQPVTNILR